MKRTARPPRRRRIVWAVALLLVALLLSWRPCDWDLLTRVLPDDALLTSYHHNVASEWHALVRHPMLIECLQNAGVEEAADLVEETGFYQTLFWLTGPHTTLALSCDGDLLSEIETLTEKTETPAVGTTGGQKNRTLPDPSDWSPKEREHWNTGKPSAIRLGGASYVGWKRRPMEFLRFIRYVPGLGRLHVTPSGTRYLVFKHSKAMKRHGLVLSLDMVDGHLLAALSTDPDAVTSLVARAKAPARTDGRMAPISTAWKKGPPHHLTLTPNFLGTSPSGFAGAALSGFAGAVPSAPLHLTLGSFRDPTRLTLDLANGTRPAQESARCDTRPRRARNEKREPEDAPASPVFAAAALSPALFPENGPRPADAPARPITLFLYGRPCPSTFCGFALPGAVTFLPPSVPPRETVQGLLDAIWAPDSKRPEWKDLGNGLARIDFRPLFGKHAIIRPGNTEQPFVYRPAEPDSDAVFGTCLDSYQALTQAASLESLQTDLATRWAATDEETRLLAAGWIDLPALATEVGQFAALLRLAATILPDAQTINDSAKLAMRATSAATSLGRAEFYLSEPFSLHAEFSRER